MFYKLQKVNIDLKLIWYIYNGSMYTPFQTISFSLTAVPIYGIGSSQKN